MLYNPSTSSSNLVQTNWDLRYDVIDVFRIKRPLEKQRFETSPYAKVKSNRRLLWHGSRCTNFGGILSQGLRIAPPEAPVSGYMFGKVSESRSPSLSPHPMEDGSKIEAWTKLLTQISFKGIYLADMSSKSAGYTCYGSSDDNGLLLLCEAELGDPMQELTQARYNAGETAKQGGMISTMGQGTTAPEKWVDASIAHPSMKGIKMVRWPPALFGTDHELKLTLDASQPDPKGTPGRTDVLQASLLYNEYICYDVAQVQLRYLFRVKISHTW